VTLHLAPVDLGDLAAVISGVTTFALVVLTYSAVRSGRASADAAARSAQLAERQLQEAQRPLLLPETPQEEDDDLLIPVRNCGSGPALRIYGRAQLLDLPPRVLGRFPRAVIPGVAPGSEAVLRFNAAGVTLRKLTSLKVTFVDLAGRSYTTESKWDRRQRCFTHTTVEERDTARVPVDIRISGGGEKSRGRLVWGARRVRDRLWRGRAASLTDPSAMRVEIAAGEPRGQRRSRSGRGANP
jgi:hypothetical protein